MKSFIIWSALVLMFGSCQNALTGKSIPNTPENNFESMWKGYDELYGMFTVRNVNWDSMYNALKPHINQHTDNQELYRVLSEMITPLNDIHVFLQPTSNGLPRYESSIFYRTNKVQQDFSIEVIRKNYLPSLFTIDDDFHYGILPGDIGYIHFSAFGMPVNFYKMQMEKVMNALKDTKGIIVDIRDGCAQGIYIVLHIRRGSLLTFVITVAAMTLLAGILPGCL